MDTGKTVVTGVVLRTTDTKETDKILTVLSPQLGKIPVIRYVCCDCGYVENWVEGAAERAKIQDVFG